MEQRNFDASGGLSDRDDDDLWSVMLPSGEARRGTLDQLDEAFQSGAINADTLVLGPGETTWAKLGALAGLEAPQSIPAPAAAVAAHSLRPVMTDLDDLPPVPEELRPKNRFMIGAFAGLALLGAGAVAFAMSVGGSSVTSTNAAGAVSAPAATSVAPIAKVAPATESPSSTASAASRLTDAQRKALADLDKQRERAADEHKKNRPAASPGSKRYKPEAPTFDVAPSHKPGKACTCKRGDPLCTCF
jgi:hypothetical protein